MLVQVQFRCIWARNYATLDTSTSSHESFSIHISAKKQKRVNHPLLPKYRVTQLKRSPNVLIARCSKNLVYFNFIGPKRASQKAYFNQQKHQLTLRLIMINQFKISSLHRNCRKNIRSQIPINVLCYSRIRQ